MEKLNEQACSAALRAYMKIEHLIVTLAFAPGTVLTESTLIDTIGLGRTPVREAIQRLSWEGLVEVRPRAGIVISPIQAGDWIKSLDVRRGVEPVLAASAARYGSARSMDRMRSVISSMRSAADNSDIDLFLAADKSFDEALAEASENRFAVRVAQPLQSHGRRFWYRYCGETNIGESAEAHLGVIESILARDPEGAAERAVNMIDHLSGYARSLI